MGGNPPRAVQYPALAGIVLRMFFRGGLTAARPGLRG